MTTAAPDTRTPASDEPTSAAGLTTVALVTLGCARNEVDSEELAGRLETEGFRLVGDPVDAEAVVVNTCGFVEAAKKDSVDTLLEAADLKEDGTTRAVVAVGCLAERYGKELAESLPEADAVLGFDDYPDIAVRLRGILAGEGHPAHTPQDRRRLLPISPTARNATDAGVVVPGHTIAAPDLPIGATPATGPRAVRRRLDGGPVAPLKLASGCDRRCSFCAIPSFRGSFVSRRPADVLGEARWLAERGVRELFLVSENSTSYGKDLGDLRLLETLLPALADVDGVERVRVSYLQPAETRPGLVRAITGTPGVADYFDLSFQHASASVLRRMRRFGDPDSFLTLLETIRSQAPLAGVRSNVIVGFPARPRTSSRRSATSSRRRGSTSSGSSATPTRTAPRQRRTPASWTRTRSGPAPTTCRRSSRSSPPSARRTGSAKRSGCSSSTSTVTPPKVAGSTRGRRSTAPRRSSVSAAPFGSATWWMLSSWPPRASTSSRR